MFSVVNKSMLVPNAVLLFQKFVQWFYSIHKTTSATPWALRVEVSGSVPVTTKWKTNFSK